jgi:amino acid adenylation domain-containing protein
MLDRALFSGRMSFFEELHRRWDESDHGGIYPDYFAARVRNAGAGLAVRFQADELTYAELNARANQVGHHLQALGVRPETLVAVCLERSLDIPITLLGIWKAGGAYLPLDPQYPTERLRGVLSDARAGMLVTQRRFRNRFAVPGVTVLCVDDPQWRRQLRRYPVTDPIADTAPDNLAYVIYTSGSTGNPKGVEITQRSLLNHNFAMASAYELGPEDRVLQFASVSFDVSIEEMFPSLLSGCAVVLRPNDSVLAARPFLKFVGKERISVLNLPTAYWHEMVRFLPTHALPGSIRLVIIGDEPASDEAYQHWRQCVPRSVKLINAYGPTEATITSTYFEADPARDTLAIGRPIANVDALVLDERFRPVTRGATGELYLGGAGLARGYRHRPELTAKRFITNPLPGEVASGRLYKTGDLVRMAGDGNLEFVGRVDRQVKVRGFRIELGEVEKVLAACPGILESVVVSRQDTSGRRRLLAYYRPSPGGRVSLSQIQGFLRDKLPAYMVPVAFIPMEAWPLTAAGKIDRRALPSPDASRPDVAQEYVPARTRYEEQLSAIWRQVLHLADVGVKDRFFDLGGDSLLAVQVIARVRDTFRIELPLSVLFEGQTIEALAGELETRAASASPAQGLMPPPRTGNTPASFVQERLWFLHELNPQSDAYNMPCALRLKGPLDVPALERALNEIVRRHEALRTTFQLLADELIQVVRPSVHLDLAVCDLGQVPGKERERRLLQVLHSEASKAFDLERGPLIRARLFRVREADHALLLVVHHAVFDGWSLVIFLQELESHYLAYASGAPSPELPRLTLQYGDYARWRRTTMQGAVLDDELQYWKTMLAQAPAEIRWPLRSRADRLRDGLSHPAQRGYGGQAGRRVFTFAPRTMQAAVKLAQREGVTPFILLLATLAITLHQWTGQKDLVIGTVVAGRSHREWEDLIGCFMNFLPLRIRLGDSWTVRAVLQEVRRVVLESQDHQNCPFEKIVAALNPERRENGNPLYNVALLWQNVPGDSLPGVSAFQAAPVRLQTQAALLDLRFEAERRGQTWALMCEYDSHLFEPDAIAGLVNRFARVFDVLVHSPSATLEDVECAGFGPRFWLKRLYLRCQDRRRGRKAVA